MGKGTPSFGKRGKRILHASCRRCGRRSYSLTKKRCAACGYGNTSMIKKPSWRTRTLHRKRAS